MDKDTNEKLAGELYADCNSLNAIAGFARNEGYAEVLLSIERHIFQAIDILEKGDG